MRFPRSGLYAITQPEGKSTAQVITEVGQAIKGGAGVIQYRDKHPQRDPELARALFRLCKSKAIPFLINDDVELAAELGADGVHLGQDDADLQAARQRLGTHAMIGVSCYNSLLLAQTAAQHGATYVAFGRFFPSQSKPLARPAAIETLIEAKKSLTLPIVAIGGILPENGAVLLEAGADVLAVIGGVFSHDVENSARAYQTLFKKQTCR